QEELMASERLATIGETVAGLAHYIKNILTGLRGGMYMVDVGMAKGKARMQQDGWGMVRRNIEKVSGLVLDLLKYSKERMPEPTVCSPNKIVLEGVELMSAKAGQHGVKLSTDLDPNLKEALLDQDGINDILLNLISNAIDACLYDTDTAKDWEVKVRTRLETDAGSGEAILFQVSDNGAGMTDEVKAKLFSRFFSTKAGRGTGLGLLITQKIVSEQGGALSFESEVGQGTTFSVRFKRSMQKS
ncbi:MAG: histidine kinase, partial [Proteobacteria bacterium]|nr:histidine kinase [Pseudomonadota bacterium]